MRDFDKEPMRHLIEDHGIKPWLIHGAYDQQHRDLHRRPTDHEHPSATTDGDGE